MSNPASVWDDLAPIDNQRSNPLATPLGFFADPLAAQVESVWSESGSDGEWTSDPLASHARALPRPFPFGRPGTRIARSDGGSMGGADSGDHPADASSASRSLPSSSSSADPRAGGGGFSPSSSAEKSSTTSQRQAESRLIWDQTLGIFSCGSRDGHDDGTPDGSYVHPKRNYLSIGIPLGPLIPLAIGRGVQLAMTVRLTVASSDVEGEEASLCLTNRARRPGDVLTRVEAIVVHDGSGWRATNVMLYPNDGTVGVPQGDVANGGRGPNDVETLVLTRLLFSRCTANNRRATGSGHRPLADERQELLTASVDVVMQVKGMGSSPPTTRVRVVSPPFIVRHDYPHKRRRTARDDVKPDTTSEQVPAAVTSAPSSPAAPPPDGTWKSSPGALTTLDRVSIGTESSPEALTVHGNALVTGTVRTLSDARLKVDIVHVSGVDALRVIRALRLYTYSWHDAVPNQTAGQRQVGLIAQEVQRVMPEAVREVQSGLPGGPATILSVDYQQVAAANVGAVRELSRIVEAHGNAIYELQCVVERPKNQQLAVFSMPEPETSKGKEATSGPPFSSREFFAWRRPCWIWPLMGLIFLISGLALLWTAQTDTSGDVTTVSDQPQRGGGVDDGFVLVPVDVENMEESDSDD